jgi:hypothetical protein
MKIPSEVVWQLTKRWNSNIVKFNGQQFSRDPLNLTGLHNASSTGSVGLSAHKEKGKKGSKRVITLQQVHKSHNKITKRKKNSQSGVYTSKIELRRGLRRIGKAVNGLNGVSAGTKKLALKRLQRLYKASRPQVKGAAAKKEEKK